ncbi:MAG: alcohol dehydrogenase catalytic domain-containing protein [Burkholderiales bacterium]|nr:MAG: alcohol dehydrogenase catalytic domain-containing protein [Burkholderiales bacterium]
MSLRCRCFRLTEHGRPLSDTAIELREPTDHEVLVRIRAAGVCHSDVHMAKGDWPGLEPPFQLGHEAIGVVEELGPGAEAFVQEGDRVIFGLGGAGGGYPASAPRWLQSRPGVNSTQRARSVQIRE